MRVLTLLTAALLTAIASADTLITIPTARKLGMGTLRFDYATEPARNLTEYSYLSYGVSPLFDFGVRSQYLTGDSRKVGLDLTYNYIAPIPGVSPGLAFGLEDVSDSTIDGRRGFVCLTFREPFDTIDGEVPADITIGGYFGHNAGAFLGVTIPFSKQFKLLVEHNAVRLITGAEFRPTPELGLRFLVQDNHTLFGVSVIKKF